MASGQTDLTLEIVKNGLLAITDEMSAALQHSAYSTNIKTRGDFSCALFDADLRLVAQSFSQPTHLGSLVHSVPRAVAEYGPENLAHGDAILMNDAHRGAVHLNDIALVSPVDLDGGRLGYVASVAHHVDVGGSTPGSLGLNREIFQEGLVLPPLKLVSDGETRTEITRLITANIRSPRESLGDFRAQIAANQLASTRFVETARKHGRANLATSMTELLEYTERRVRACLLDLPDGVYTAHDYLDDDGFADDPIRIAATVRIAGDTISFDLTDCAAQVSGPMNATRSMSYSGVAFVTKTLLDADVPINDGFYRHLSYRTEQGTVVDAVHPAAVAGGWEVCFRVAETCFQALAPVLPDRIPAGTKGIICNVSFGGYNAQKHEHYAFYETIAGGFGGTAKADGMDGVQPHVHNTENAPVEETEAEYPVRIDRFELVTDSGGAGEHRGGLGVRRDYWFVGDDTSFSIVSDRTKFQPHALDGAQPGSPAEFVLAPGAADEQVLRSKCTVRLAPGQLISVRTPGGGGHGDPRRRGTAELAADLAAGKVSADALRDRYGLTADQVAEVTRVAGELR